MTQVLAALTPNFVLVASDRRLSWVGGARDGAILSDDSCKLVSLCGVWGIAYTGYSHLQDTPTHEWIAMRLAENACRDADVAGEILARAAGAALSSDHRAPIEQAFLIAGWLGTTEPVKIQPCFLLVSNMYADGGRRLSVPSHNFVRFKRTLKAGEACAFHVVGRPLQRVRQKALGRSFRRMLKHSVGPKSAMRRFTQEIQYSSCIDRRVGERILAFSISRAAAERTYQTGLVMLAAAEPNLSNAAFCYFDPAYSRLRQYGPTFTCGKWAATDVETEEDPDRQRDSAGMRLLYVPAPPLADGEL